MGIIEPIPNDDIREDLDWNPEHNDDEQSAWNLPAPGEIRLTAAETTRVAIGTRV